MKTYKIEVETTGREVYYTMAATGEEALRMFEDGELTQPSLSEVLNADVIDVGEV